VIGDLGIEGIQIADCGIEGFPPNKLAGREGLRDEGFGDYK